MSPRVDLLCELLRSSAVIVNRPVVRKQLLSLLRAEGCPESLILVLIQGFEWRDLSKDLRLTLDTQNEKVYAIARDVSLRGWEAVEEKRHQKEAWKTRWDTSYWTPGNPIYDQLHKDR